MPTATPVVPTRPPSLPVRHAREHPHPEGYPAVIDMGFGLAVDHRSERPEMTKSRHREAPRPPFGAGMTRLPVPHVYYWYPASCGVVVSWCLGSPYRSRDRGRHTRSRVDANKYELCKLIRRADPTACYVLPWDRAELDARMDGKQLFVLKQDQYGKNTHAGSGVSYIREQRDIPAAARTASSSYLVQPCVNTLPLIWSSCAKTRARAVLISRWQTKYPAMTDAVGAGSVSHEYLMGDQQ